MSAHRETIRTARSLVVKVGTNALTTPSGVFDAGRLAVLSDIDGLYDSDPRKTKGAKFIPEVSGAADLDGVVAGPGSHLGTGGMASKMSSALLAADAGVPVLLAAATDAATALSDASRGTVFAPRPVRMSARRFWV